MAYIVGFEVVENVVAGTTTVGVMPEHVADDMLIAFAAKDGTGALTETSASGWNALSSGAGAAQWVGAWWKRATGSAEVAPTWTHANDESNVVIVNVRGAHTSTAPSSAIATDDNTMAGGGFLFNQSFTSPSTNSLILFGMGTDTGMGPCPMPGFGQSLYPGDAGTCSCGVSWQFFKSSGVNVNGYRFFGAVSDNMRTVAVGVPDNGSNEYEPGRVDLGSTDPVLLGGAMTGSTVNSHDTTWTSAASNSITMLGNDWAQVWSFDGTSTYLNETTDANDDGTGDVTITNAVGAILYLGAAPGTVYDSFCVDVGTAGTGGGVLVYEYYNGSTWATLSTTFLRGVASWNTNWTVAGIGVIRFVPPSDWADVSVNSVNGRYVRVRVSTGWTAPPTLDQCLRDGRPLIFDSSGGVADSGVNAYWGGIGTTPLTQTATPANHGGGEYRATVARNMSSGYYLTSYRYTAKRDILDCGFYHAHKGVALTLMDANAENRRTSWIIASKDSPDTSGDKRSIIGIQPSQTIDTAWARHGNLDESAVDTVLYTTSSAFGAMSGSGSMLFRAGEQVLAGGTSALPLNFFQIVEALVNGTQLFPILDTQGSLADVWHPIKFGGGDAVHMSVNLRTFQFPTRAAAVDKTTRWHVDDNLIGFDFDARSGDTCRITNSVFLGGTPYYWRFNANASAAATWDFSGSTIVGATVTLRAVYTFTGLTFIDCAEIVLNSALVQDTTIRDTRAPTTAGAILFPSVAQSDNVERIEFINNHDGDIGHSIRITAAGTYTFDGHTFTGGGPTHFGFHTQTGVDAAADEVDQTAHGYATGDAVYYQDQGGTDTIGLTDGVLYYVRAVTVDALAFYTTKAAAESDTGRINLSDGSGGETHYIYSAKADVFVDVSGATTINVTNGDTPTIRLRDGATVVIVVSPVVALFKAVDSTTGANIPNADVLVVGASTFIGGAAVGITRSGSTASVSHTAHGFSDGDTVRIRGSVETEYHGLRVITNVTTNAYDYTVSGTPATPATGSPVAALVIVAGVTDSNGEISDTRSWAGDQVFSGRFRRAAISPTYKSQPVAGTISASSGVSVTAPMVAD